MTKTALYFGSFNPIHNGHLAIANYMVEYTDINRLWFIISPQNPFKKKKSLLADYHRYELACRAIGKLEKYWVSNIEFNLPKPSYTTKTLAYLEEKYPKHKFVLIMGSDCLATLNKWKNYEVIIENYEIYVYPRPNFKAEEFSNLENFIITDAPQMEISSSFIRKSVKAKKDVRFFMPDSVWNYIEEMHFYER
jgi:nicotinate-nucleotide adenylyltransferase